MRPQALAPLFASLQSLSGVGPRVLKLFARLLPGPTEEPRVIDLLFHLPAGIIDRSDRPLIAEARAGAIVTLDITVLAHEPPPRGRARVPYRIRCEDGSSGVMLVYFHARPDYLQRLLPVGARRLVSGRFDLYDGLAQMTHPDHVVPPEDAARMPLIEPVYPLTAGLSSKVVLKAAAQALERLPAIDEWQDPAWLDRRKWPAFAPALRQAHAPSALPDLEPSHPARARLAFDELLANQLALALVRGRIKKASGRPLKGDGQIRAAINAALPYSLTGAQRMALAEITADMASPDRMLRLLQGDVGSGKTVVALHAMATAVEAGAQAALMAPTEVLARQHHRTIAPLAEKAGMTVALLTGREKGKTREKLLAGFAGGDIQIAIGTHALFQEDVAFRDLGLAVVDEQHRFGVHQRLALQSKGRSAADMLVMTATPIPRTLLMTHYGDMDVSRLHEKPAGRQPVATRALPLERIAEVTDRLASAIRSGAQAYWVCPLVEESEKLDVAAAEERYAALQKQFGPRVALLHGKMPAARKDEVMAAFAAGDIAILVATTVIEVGVDVPNATIMVIEHAERFGLSQLHQLRGRVGRGTGKSSCILLYQQPLGETARSRISILRQTEDGFLIAEEDLRLRGGGELLGTRQSGLPAFRLAELPRDEELLAAARDDARLILSRDARLEGARGQALRTLLYLFGRDDAIRLLSAG
ncbi:MAG: ATP-dependent DNA helicase RecG [Pseudomonadota bacterium]|nr:ATP-dependent DNA helicase RecG [Pseudomonadota bacterium]